MRRWKKYSLIALSLVLFAAVGYWLWSYIAFSSSWSRLLALKSELDQSDPGWRLEEILTERHASFPPGDENPRAVTEQVVALLPGNFNNWMLNPTATSSQYRDWLPEVELNRLPREEHAANAACIALEAREAIEKARSLRFCEKNGGAVLVVPDNPWGTLLPTTQNVRQVANVLQLDTTISAIHGDGNRAIESVQANLHAAKSLVGEPTLISHLVRVAVISVSIRNLERTLALTAPERGLAELQADFTKEIEVPSMTLALRGERAFSNRMFENLEYGKLDLYATITSISTGGLTSVPVIDRLYLMQYRPMVPADHLAMMRALTQMQEVTRMPLHKQKNAMANVKKPDRRYILSHMLLPAIEKVHEAELRVQTQMRCAVVAIACERYRQKHQRWPANLRELGSEFLPGGVPLDPYSGQLLQYRRYPGGAVVYGLGIDGKDDEGNLSLAGQAGTDIGFRLWDLDRRSMEPLPANTTPD